MIIKADISLDLEAFLPDPISLSTRSNGHVAGEVVYKSAEGFASTLLPCKMMLVQQSIHSQSS